jgi:hypothetical protein
MFPTLEPLCDPAYGISGIVNAATIDRVNVITRLRLDGAEAIVGEPDSELFPAADLCGVSVDRQNVGSFTHAAAVYRGQLVPLLVRIATRLLVTLETMR